jgi:hypothetical protein
MTESSLNYERVERQLASADIESGAAEVQGILCGLLCVGAQEPLSRWMAELFDQERAGDLLVKECADSLRILYREAMANLDGDELGLTPFLPEDRQPFRQRAAAVAEWCQGFLYGVGLGELPSGHQFSVEAQESLSALTEVSRMDLEGLQGSEEDEAALVEVTEFFWVAAMALHADQVRPQAGGV